MFSTILAACPEGTFSADCLDDIQKQVPGYLFQYRSLGEIINGGLTFSVVNILFFVGGIALLINLIFAGIGLMMSAGDPSKISAGKERIKNGVLGLVLMITAYWIVQIIGTILNLPGITGTFLN